MELEEMQIVWSQMSAQLEHQKKLTNKLIMEMIQQRFKAKIGIISKYEGMGAIVCFSAAILLLFQMEKLDTWYLMAAGLFTLLYLIVVPILALLSVSAMRRINLTRNSYRDTVADYVKKQKHFLLTQRVAIYFNFILLLVSLPVVFKVFKNEDLFVSNIQLMYWYIPVMTVFLILFSRWGYGKYKSVTTSASRILEELEAPGA